MRTAMLGLLLAVCSPVAVAQDADVTFFVIGKHANFHQDESGRLSPVDYSFFSEIFLTGDGDAANAWLTDPVGNRTAYADRREAEGGERDNLLLVSGKRRYEDFSALQADYPDGTYTIAFETPDGPVRDAKLEFSEGSLPAAPGIRLQQDAGPVCAAVDSARDLEISWTPFTGGGPDPRGILDDLVFAIVTDEDGNRVAHSGRPFEGKPYLTYAARRFVVPAGTLRADTRYTVSVEHAILDDTRIYGDIPAMTTRAVTTTLAVSTDTRDHDRERSCMPDKAAPAITAQTVMFYYKDLDAAVSFYGTALGLEQTLDWSWAKMFRTGPDSTVGVIQDGHGYHPARPGSAVMLSLVTDDVDAWYRRLKARKDVKFLKEIQDGGGIRSFLLEDPGGYTVEFFQWLDEAGTP